MLKFLRTFIKAISPDRSVPPKPYKFKSGRTPANVVLQASRRLLKASLDSNSPNAAIEYDRRVSEVESLAEKNLALGTGTRQDVAQAESSRLDAILKDLLSHSDSRNN